MQHNRIPERSVPIDDEIYALESHLPNPDELLLQSCDGEMVRSALEELPPEFREVLVLREFEELSYKEIARITDAPIGTVMSRLARGRKRLQLALTGHDCVEVLS